MKNLICVLLALVAIALSGCGKGEDEAAKKKAAQEAREAEKQTLEKAKLALEARIKAAGANLSQLENGKEPDLAESAWLATVTDEKTAVDLLVSNDFTDTDQRVREAAARKAAMVGGEYARQAAIKAANDDNQLVAKTGRKALHLMSGYETRNISEGAHIRINAEEVARTNADVDLNRKISDETAARVAADEKLEKKLSEATEATKAIEKDVKETREQVKTLIAERDRENKRAAALYEEALKVANEAKAKADKGEKVSVDTMQKLNAHEAQANQVSALAKSKDDQLALSQARLSQQVEMLNASKAAEAAIKAAQQRCTGLSCPLVPAPTYFAPGSQGGYRFGGRRGN